MGKRKWKRKSKQNRTNCSNFCESVDQQESVLKTFSTSRSGNILRKLREASAPKFFTYTNLELHIIQTHQSDDYI